MNIQDFLQNYKAVCISEKENVIVFKGYEYTPLFFSIVCEKIRKDDERMLKVISPEGVDVISLFSQLSISFLGSTALYWLGDFSKYSPTQQKKVLQFLKIYQGPHIVMVYIPNKTVDSVDFGLVVEMEKEYTYDEIKSVSNLYAAKNLTETIFFLRAMFQRKKTYALEELFLLLQYQAVIGKNKDMFLDQWFPKLAVDDYSLFYVSELFFAKKNDEFVEYWNNVFYQYSEMFWVSFWSDQFFKAYCYAFQKHQNKIVSKYETYGLAFSFLKFDWKKHDLEALKQCHKKMYQIDAILKNGGNSRLMFTALLSCL